MANKKSADEIYEGALRGAETHYFDKSGNIVRGARQFAGLVLKALNAPNNDPTSWSGLDNFSAAQIASAKRSALSAQAKVRAIGKAEYLKKIAAARKQGVKGAKTLFSSMSVERAGETRKGRKGNTHGPKRPVMVFKGLVGKGNKQTATITESTITKTATSDYKDGSRSRGDKYTVKVWTYTNADGKRVKTSKLRNAKAGAAAVKGCRIS